LLQILVLLSMLGSPQPLPLLGTLLLCGVVCMLVVLGLTGSLGYDIYKFGGGLLLLLMALSGMILSLFFTIGFTVLALKRVGALLSKANPPDGLLLLNFYPM